VPLDPSIILGGRQVAIPNPQEAQAAALEVQGKQLEYSEKVRSLKNQAAVRSILARYGGDLEKALPELNQVDPELGMKAQEQVFQNKRHQLDFKLAQTEFHDKQINSLAKRADTVNDELSYQAFRQAAKAMDVPEADQLPTSWDDHTKLVLQGIQESTLTYKDKLENDRKQLHEQIAMLKATLEKPQTEAQLDARFQELAGKAASGQVLTPQEKAEYEGYKERKTLTAKEGGVTEAKLDERFQELQTKINSKQPLTPAEQAEYQAYKQRKTLVPVATFNMNAPARSDARSDRGYQQANTQLTNLRKPLADQAERLSRLVSSINQMTPQADALLAPELLTVMAGGQGSGLRMNEAEISRIVGGRSKFESLKAALNQWSLDPSKALSITSEQRQEMRALVREVAQRSSQRLKDIDAANTALIDAPDVESQRRIVAGVKSKLDEAGTETPAGGPIKVGGFTVVVHP
jgi:hypothetical protein